MLAMCGAPAASAAPRPMTDPTGLHEVRMGVAWWTAHTVYGCPDGVSASVAPDRELHDELGTSEDVEGLATVLAPQVGGGEFVIARSIADIYRTNRAFEELDRTCRRRRQQLYCSDLLTLRAMREAEEDRCSIIRHEPRAVDEGARAVHLPSRREGRLMAGAKIVWTRWPGIGRRGDRWVYEWTDATGKRRRGTADTREQASTLKAEREAEAARGEFGEAGPRSRLTLAGYALDLFGADLDRDDDAKPARGRYQGRKGAVRESTRADYRRDLERYWLPALGRRPLAKVTTPDLGRVVANLAARNGDDYLADRTIRRVFAPLGALMATAAEEGAIASNPARDVRLPSGRDALRRFDETPTMVTTRRPGRHGR
jgi:hypothetical protein